MITRASWYVATVGAVAKETPRAHRITLDVPDWPGNIAGQHLDVRLTAANVYQASRSYSIASAGGGRTVELAVDKLPGGEVSPFLVDVVAVGDQMEIRGPLGGWFLWQPAGETQEPVRPVQLNGGGSGAVPLIAMIRSHQDSEDPTEFRLLYAVRTPEQIFYRQEIGAAQSAAAPLRVNYVFSQATPPDWAVPAGRLTRSSLEGALITAIRNPRLFVCGSTGFTERVLGWLKELGYDTSDVRAERFGGS